MKKLFVAVLLFTSVGFSKTLIVSDIDDTIKASHVRDTADSVMNAYITTLAFKGMKEVYSEVLRNSDSEIIYVTNALEFLMHSSHTDFLKENQFPKGKIFLRSESAETHKYNTIKKYLEKNPTIDRLILVGDNGEKDPEFYDKIFQEYKDRLDIKTYIRVAYSDVSLTNNQIPFVSPLELMADLTVNYFIPIERYFVITEALAEEISVSKKTDARRPQYFPKWVTCSGFIAGLYPGLMSPIIEKGYEKVREICN